MELNLEGEHASRAASVLGALIAPRPIALITTVGADGVVNAAPYSFFNLLGTRPPLLIFAAGDKEDGRQKDTPRNIQLTQEFVVNLVDEGIAKAMNECSAELPYGVSELAQAGLTAVPSATVRPPRIAEAPAALECREWGTLRVGKNRLVLGLIKRVFVKDELADPEKLRVRLDRYFPIGRMGGPDLYSRTRDRFAMPRPE